MSEIITRYLKALAAAPEERDEIVHYIYQQDGNLIKKSFIQDWTLPDLIGPAKPGTSVAYYLDDEKEIVISVNESNVLQDYQLTEDEDWIPGSLSGLNFVASSNTKMSITNHGEELHLYYQKDSGAIQELIFSIDSGVATWKARGELSIASPVKDTGIAAATKAGLIYVFYVHLDRSIHRLTYGENGWTDDKAGNLEDESLPARIATSVEDDRLSVYYQTESGVVVALEDEVSGPKKIGVVGADGTFNNIAEGPREERFMANFASGRICVIM